MLTLKHSVLPDFGLRLTFGRLKLFQRKLSPPSSKPCQPVLGRIGDLEVRLSRSRSELKAAQRLRYEVFYQEMSARHSLKTRARRLDTDAFDAVCDHLIVVDKNHEATGAEKIVGTYRLLRQDMAERHDGFYTQHEYNIDEIVRAHPTRRFLELGRSCVLEKYRTKRTVELLWHGIWAYVLHHKIDVMFGCASLEGTDPVALQQQLSLLAQVNPTPDEWHVKAQEERYVPMAQTAAKLDRRVLSTLPPLLKGYLRLGAYIGDGAVIDHDFGTTDVLVVLPVENINPRYVSYYGEDAGRHAA